MWNGSLKQRKDCKIITRESVIIQKHKNIIFMLIINIIKQKNRNVHIREDKNNSEI